MLQYHADDLLLLLLLLLLLMLAMMVIMMTVMVVVLMMKDDDGHDDEDFDDDDYAHRGDDANTNDDLSYAIGVDSTWLLLAFLLFPVQLNRRRLPYISHLRPTLKL